MSRLRQCSLIGSLMVAVWIGSARVQAQSADEYLQYFNAGTEYYQGGEFKDAAEQFEKAFRLEPRRDIAFALAQALRQAGDCDKALVHYRWLLESVEGDQRKAVMEAMQPCVEEIEPEPKKPPPLARRKSVVTTASPTGPNPREASWYRDVAGGSLAGLGIAVLGVGGYSAIKSRSAFEKSRNSLSETEFERFVAEGERYEKWRNWSLGVGGALLVGGIVRYIWVATENSSEGALVFTASPEGHLWVTGRF